MPNVSMTRNLILLSRFDKNLPRMLIASTRKPPLSSMLMMVSTHSYKIALPAFLFDSVLVATWEIITRQWKMKREALTQTKHDAIATQLTVFNNCKHK